MTDISELPDKDFKVTFEKMLQQAITNILETKRKSLSKETEDIKMATPRLYPHTN